MKPIYLLILSLIVMLTGCSTTTEMGTRVVTENEYVTVKISKKYLEKNLVNAPITEEVYLAMSKDEREDWLIRYLSQPFTAASFCFKDKASIGEEITASEQMVDKLNQK